MSPALTTLTNYPELPIVDAVTYTDVSNATGSGKNMGNSRVVMGSLEMQHFLFDNYPQCAYKGVTK
jgi:hypothetical protein